MFAIIPLYSVADPGFPVGGGADPLGGGGGTDLRCVHFSAKTYVKMKEMDPVGERAPAAPPGSANAIAVHVLRKYPVIYLECSK